MWQLCEIVSPFFLWFGSKFGHTLGDRNHKTGAYNSVVRYKEVIWRPLPLPHKCGLMLMCFFGGGLHNKLVLLSGSIGESKTTTRANWQEKQPCFLPKSMFIESYMPPSDWKDGWHQNLWTSCWYSVQKWIVSPSLNESHANFTKSQGSFIKAQSILVSHFISYCTWLPGLTLQIHPHVAFFLWKFHWCCSCCQQAHRCCLQCLNSPVLCVPNACMNSVNNNTEHQMLYRLKFVGWALMTLLCPSSGMLDCIL